MVVGLFVLIIFLFLIYFSSQEASSATEANPNRVSSAQIERSKVRGFVTACLEDATKEAIQLAGLQGGRIYNHQLPDEAGGTIYEGPENPPLDLYGSDVVPYYYEGSVYDVAYHLEPRDNTTCLLNKVLGEPLDHGSGLNCFPYGEDRLMEPKYADLRVLCEKNGSNRQDLEGARYSCLNYRETGSLQEQISSYVLEETVSCVRSVNLEEEFDMGMTIESSNASVEVLFGEDNVLSSLDLQVSMMAENGTLMEGTFEDFSASVAVRFKKMYDTIYYLLGEEARDIFNNLKNAGKGHLSGCEDFNATLDERNMAVNCYRDQFMFKYIGNACNYTENNYGIRLCNEQGQEASFLVLKDNASQAIGSQPFQFVVAIGNRRPLIDKISYHDFGDEYKKYLSDYYNTTPEKLYENTSTPLDPAREDYDVIVDFDSQLRIFPRAIDPDEDYDDYNDSVMDTDYSYDGWKAAELMDSTAYESGIPYPVGIAAPRSLHRDAVYNLSATDVGTHDTKINVYDRAMHLAEESIHMQVRCRDKRRGHAVGENQTPPGYPSWVEYTGDYNYSEYADPDRNNTNDCCNESGGYEWANKGHKCGICKRCLSNGTCAVNVTAGNDEDDCPLCWSCNGSTDNYKFNYSISCKINDSHNQSCANKFAGDGVCCEGHCFNGSDPAQLDEFDYPVKNATAMNASNAMCWRQEPTCASGDPLHHQYLADDNVFYHYENLEGNYTYVPKEEGKYPGCNNTAPDPDPTDPHRCNEAGECISTGVVPGP